MGPGTDFFNVTYGIPLYDLASCYFVVDAGVDYV